MAQTLLDPIIIAQLGNLELRARRILDGLYAGHHLNKNRGHAQDFSEHRPYNPGDDLRGIDWKVFGRTDRLVIKQYEEQTNVGVTVLFDHSRSMEYSLDGRMTKLDYAKTMAAAIGYLVVSQGDSIGLAASDTYIPPGGKLAHLNHFIETLSGFSGAGVWDIKKSSERLSSHQKKSGFVILISDLMAEEETILSTLRFFQAQKNEVVVFQVLDPAELNLPFDGPVLFEDLESGEQLKTDPGTIRQSYQAFVEQKLSSFSNLLRSTGIEHLAITTNTPFDKGLGAYLSWRGHTL